MIRVYVLSVLAVAMLVQAGCATTNKSDDLTKLLEQERQETLTLERQLAEQRRRIEEAELERQALAEAKEPYGYRLADPAAPFGAAILTCRGLDLLALSSPGLLYCARERAQVISRRLNLAAQDASGMSFELRIEGDAVQIFQIGHMGGNEHLTITVSNDDVEAYRKAGLKHLGERYGPFSEELDKHMLAKWWRDLLLDYNTVFCEGARPVRVIDTFCGKVLMSIQERAVADGRGLFESVFQDVYSSLSMEAKMHLNMISSMVPMDYHPMD